ncbi:unnamed protein product, partial [Meganyctiphanes norvegica]
MSSGGGIIVGGAACKTCRCEFPPEIIKDRTCPRCSKNQQKYGKPRACEHCNVAAAFIGLKCQKCANSIKKYGPPIRCCKCKLKCAFNRPGHDKERALCLMCMFARQRAKASQNGANTSLNKSSSDEKPNTVNAKNGDDDDVSTDMLDAKNPSTPNGRPDNFKLTPGDNGRNYRVQPRGYFLQTNFIQEFDWNDEGKTDLIGGWARSRRSSLEGPVNPPTPSHLVSSYGRGTGTRRKSGMSTGDQMVMVLDLQAKIAKLNATLSRKDNELLEKDVYWNRKLEEEKVLIEQSVKELDQYQQVEEKKMRVLVSELGGKLSVANTELTELREKAKEREREKKEKDRAQRRIIAKAEAEKESAMEKDPDDIKRYGDDQEDMDVDADDRGKDQEEEEKQNGDSNDKSEDASDEENDNSTGVKKKTGQTNSDDEDSKEDSAKSGDEEPDSNSNENKKNKRKAGMIFSDSEDDEDQKKTKSDSDMTSDKEDISDKPDPDKINSDTEGKKNKRKGAIVFSDSEDDENQQGTKSDNGNNSDKEGASATADSDKNSDSGKEDSTSDKEHANSDQEHSNH